MLLDFFSNHIVINVLCSLAAALLFLFIILFFLGPSIRISKFIVKRAGIEKRDEPETVYVFKFVNKSYFPAFDINLELFRLEKIPVAEGKSDLRYKKVDMVENTLKYVPGYWYFGEINRVGNFAVLPKTFEQIEEHIGDEHVYLQLQVTAKHGLTGLSRVFKKDFVVIDHCIKTGKHQHGRRLGIKG